MSEHDDREEPRTALEEVLHEVEEAERRTREEEPPEHHRRGGDGDAVTPSPRAQEEARED